jgi:hypothetical protein
LDSLEQQNRNKAFSCTAKVASKHFVRKKLDVKKLLIKIPSLCIKIICVTARIFLMIALPAADRSVSVRRSGVYVYCIWSAWNNYGLVHVMRIHPHTLVTVILPLVHWYNYEPLIFLLHTISKKGCIHTKRFLKRLIKGTVEEW